MPTDLIYGVILAGGSGTRLWPVSRESLPKHLAPMVGDRTLLQTTASRIIEIIPPNRVLTVAGENCSFELKRQLADVHPDLGERLLLEPMGKNTLPAIAWAAMRIVSEEPEAVIAVFPSDHMVDGSEGFDQCLRKALNLASKGFLVTLGIAPDSPETGYGYIRVGETVGGPGDGFVVSAFVEKPDVETAKKYLQSGSYLWNSGMFAFRASAFLGEVKKLQPAVFETMSAIAALPPGSPELSKLYATLPNLSVDYGIMEKADRIAVVRSSFAWSDLGSWDAVHRFKEKDEHRNVIEGPVMALDSEDCLLWSKSHNRTLAAVGVRDLAVVQTDDATLIVNRSRTQEVKALVERLKGQNSPLVESPATVARPWGQFTVLEEGSHYKIKRIIVKPGQMLSLQKHEHRAEHWVVIEGTATVTKGDAQLTLQANESTFIPQGERHRLANAGKTPLVIIEVQTGNYLGEDDIQRFDDIYGRAHAPKKSAST